MWNMSRKIVATVLTLAVPAAASAGPGASSDPDSPAGPIRKAIERAGDDLVAAKRQEVRSRGRFWTGIGLIAGGTVLGVLSQVELGDDEAGPDDGEDIDGSDDGEDSDGWGNKAMLGGGIAAATIGGVILMTGKKSGPVVTAKRGGFAIRQAIRF
jgi:hypothetical protein